jgi:hypothetical protein
LLSLSLSSLSLSFLRKPYSPHFTLNFPKRYPNRTGLLYLYNMNHNGNYLQFLSRCLSLSPQILSDFLCGNICHQNEANLIC